MRVPALAWPGALAAGDPSAFSSGYTLRQAGTRGQGLWSTLDPPDFATALPAPTAPVLSNCGPQVLLGLGLPGLPRPRLTPAQVPLILPDPGPARSSLTPIPAAISPKPRAVPAWSRFSPAWPARPCSASRGPRPSGKMAAR